MPPSHGGDRGSIPLGATNFDSKTTRQSGLVLLKGRMMTIRTLIATVLQNGKDKEVLCSAKKVSDRDLETIRNCDRGMLEEIGFTFIKLMSLELSGVRGFAIFYEGHLDEMVRRLKDLQRGY